MSKKQFSNNLEHVNNKDISAAKFESFSGPLPHPGILKQFDDVVPGAAERIIKMAENQSEHRRNLEKSVIDSDIKRSKYGQVLGFIIAGIGLVITAVIGVWGNPIVSGLLGFTTLGSLVGVFVHGSNVRSKERIEKK